MSTPTDTLVQKPAPPVTTDGQGREREPSGPYCRRCGYALRGLPEPRCPECGRAFVPGDARTTDRRPWRRHARRWSKVAAAVVLVPLAVAGSVWLYIYFGWRAEQPVIQAARADKVSFDWTFAAPAWPPYRGRSDIRRRAVRADMYGESIDKHLPRIAALGHLRSLTLRSPSDASLAGLADARGLRGLMILYDHNGLGESGVDRVRDLPKLESLEVHFVPITRIRREALDSLPSLRRLSLHGTRVNDAGLAELRGLKTLQWLRLGETDVTDAGMEHLATLDGLELLDLDRTRVTQAGFLRLQRLPRLRSVNVNFMPTDDAVPAIRAFPALRGLGVHPQGPGDTRERYEALRRALPGMISGGSW